MTPNAKGTKTEGAILAALLRQGHNVLIPFGACRYDLVFEQAGGFYRVQCKTGWSKTSSTLTFAVASQPPGYPKRTYLGEIDYFGVYLTERDQTFLVPFDAVAHCTREATLRLAPAKNGQIKGTLDASEYLL